MYFTHTFRCLLCEQKSQLFFFLFFFKVLVNRKILGNFYLGEECVLQKCLLTLILSLGGPRSSGCSALPELVMMSLTLIKGHFSVLV